MSVGKVQLANVAPSIKRRETRMLLADLLLRMAERQHKLLVLEDLHWADPSALEVVEQLVANVHGRSVVVIGSHRPNFERNKHRMSEDVLRQVVERADGVPLYLEELSRAVQVSTEDGQTDAHVVPNPS